MEFVLFLVCVEILLNVLSFQQKTTEPEQNTANHEGKVILCLGDSHTYGLGSPGKHAYPKQLETILNDQNPPEPVTVINGGICGFNTTRILEKLPENLNKYQPDIIILMAGDNNYWYRYGFDKYINGHVSLVNRLLSKLAISKFIRRYLFKKNNTIEKQPDNGFAKYSPNILPTPLPELQLVKIEDFSTTFIPENSKVPLNSTNEWDWIHAGQNSVNFEEMEYYFLNCLQTAKNASTKREAIVNLIRIYQAQLELSYQYKIIFLAHQALQLTPQHPAKIFVDVGLVLVRLKDFQRGWKWIYAGIKSNPTCPSFFLAIYSYITKQGQGKKADAAQQVIKDLKQLPTKNTCINNFIASAKSLLNDQTPAWIRHDFRQIIETASAAGAKTVLMTYTTSPSTQLNQTISKYANAHNIPLINVAEVFSKLPSEHRPTYFAKTNGHLNEKGNRFLARIIANTPFIREEIFLSAER